MCPNSQPMSTDCILLGETSRQEGELCRSESCRSWNRGDSHGGRSDDTGSTYAHALVPTGNECEKNPAFGVVRNRLYVRTIVSFLLFAFLARFVNVHSAL